LSTALELVFEYVGGVVFTGSMAEENRPPSDPAPPTPVEERSNAVHEFAGAAHRALDRVSGTPGWSLTLAEQEETLAELDRIVTRLVELKSRVVALADLNDIGAEHGHCSTASWLAASTKQNRSRCNGDVALARLLDQPVYSAIQQAMATAAVNPDQAWVILRCLEDLPTQGEDAEVTPEQLQAAQHHLIGLAADYDAKTLRMLAQRIFEVIAPDQADRREAEALAREERRARAKTRFAMRDNGDGTHSGWFKVPTAQAAILSKVVQAYAAPRRTNPDAWTDADGNKIPYAARLGLAFCDLIDHLPTDGMPQAGGLAAAVTVNVDLDTLRTGLGSAVLDTGEHISPGQTRRMACVAGIIPVVLGSDSVPLDLGRTSRLFSHAQRVALALRDGGCTADGCDRPPAWCEAHHDTPWSHGGATDLANARLLCPHHHQLAHDERYDMRRLPDGKVRFVRRQ
jgi:hypothetical protein